MRCVSVKLSWLMLLYVGEVPYLHKMFFFFVFSTLFLLEYGSWSLSPGLLLWKHRWGYFYALSSS
uniref:Uncharacterized protein n=1 Tax=Arundo donax TaxID=35708 RepID=A0A0A9BU60_ARUDO